MALVVKIRGDATHLEKTMRGVQASVTGLSSGLGKAAIAGAGFAAALAGISTAEAVISKLGETLKDASGKASGMETLQVQFEVLTKSADTAKNLIAQFRQEAIKSPLSVTDYAQAAQKMLTVGTSAEDILPALKMIGDVSLGNSLKFERLALAYSQIISKGRLLGTENNQLAESGFAPLAFIAKRTGETMAQLMKRMEDSAISSGEVTQAFKDATSSGGLFFGALDRGAQTMEGKMAKLTDGIDMLKVSFGTGMNNGLKNALDATNATLPQLEARFTQFGESFGKAITDGVNGNFEIFLQAGLLMGEAIKQGIMDVVGNAPVDAIRAYTQSTAGLVGPGTQAAAQVITDAAFGPQRTMGQRAEDIKTSLAGPVRQFEETITRRDSERIIEELVRNRQATERLLEKGVKVTKESLAVELHSR